MVAMSTLHSDALPVTVKNTFINLVEHCSPKHATRSSSLPPSLNRSPSERSTIEASSDCLCLGTDDGQLEFANSRSGEESEGLSFPDVEDEWEAERLPFPDTEDEWESCSSRSRCPAPCASPGAPAPLRGADAEVFGRHRPEPLLIVCPSVPNFRGNVVMASEPRGRRPAARLASESSLCVESAPSNTRQASQLPLLPRSHSHAISIKNMLVDAEDDSHSSAEASFKVLCEGGEGRIAVVRMVRRSRLNRQAQAWALPAARGAEGPPAQAPGRTKLSSRARAWEPAAGSAAPALAANAASPSEKAPAPLVPSTLADVPKFGFALLQGVKEALRKNVFVAGVDISASAKGGWCVQIGVRRHHLYLKEHVLACAQEAAFDALDRLEALRAGGPGSGRGIPETVFDLKVQCADSDGGR